MTFIFPTRGSNLVNRFQPFCLEQPQQQSKSLIKRIGPFILIALILGVIILIPQGEENAPTSIVPPNISPNYTNYIVHDPINITDDGELAAVANNGTGTANDPYIIAGWNITSSNTDGISITGTTKHFRVVNCWIANSTDSGIHVLDVASGTASIITNICIGDTPGIFLENTNSSTVANNTCNSNDWTGIILLASAFSAVANNTCNNNNGWGIILAPQPWSPFNCDNSTVIKNTCTANGRSGILLGPFLASLTVVNNTCAHNDENGICLWWESNHNFVMWNLVSENRYYGIVLFEDSYNNRIHHNNFKGNGLNPQACDNGTNNQWYDVTILEGNYWSDYSGAGSYLIVGSAGASDPYPSLSPYRYTSTTTSTPSPAWTVLIVLVSLGILGFRKQRLKA